MNKRLNIVDILLIYKVGWEAASIITEYKIWLEMYTRKRKVIRKFRNLVRIEFAKKTFCNSGAEGFYPQYGYLWSQFNRKYTVCYVKKEILSKLIIEQICKITQYYYQCSECKSIRRMMDKMLRTINLEHQPVFHLSFVEDSQFVRYYVNPYWTICKGYSLRRSRAQLILRSAKLYDKEHKHYDFAILCIKIMEKSGFFTSHRDERIYNILVL